MVHLYDAHIYLLLVYHGEPDWGLLFLCYTYRTIWDL